jgi:hypothetical protein
VRERGLLLLLLGPSDRFHYMTRSGELGSGGGTHSHSTILVLF